MRITSTKFIKGLVDDDEILSDGTPQIAFIGRSNVGKSSLINFITNSKVSRTSAFPGSTQQINVFLVNSEFYFVDLPGYGFARASGAGRERIGELIDSYLFNSLSTQKKVVLIIDANVGMTDKDMSMFEELQNHKKDFIVVLSKVDKMNQSAYQKQLNEIKKIIGDRKFFPISSKKKTGLEPFVDELLAN